MVSIAWAKQNSCEEMIKWPEMWKISVYLTEKISTFLKQEQVKWSQIIKGNRKHINKKFIGLVNKFYQQFYGNSGSNSLIERYNLSHFVNISLYISLYIS